MGKVLVIVTLMFASDGSFDSLDVVEIETPTDYACMHFRDKMQDKDLRLSNGSVYLRHAYCTEK